MSGPSRNEPGESGGSTTFRDIYDVEILRKAALAAGWSAEYRQLGAGPLTVRSVAIQCADMLVVAQEVDRALEVVGKPPPGVLTVLVPAPGDGYWVNGYSAGDTELIVLAPGTEIYAVTRSAATMCAVHIPESRIDGGTSGLDSHREGFERGWVIPAPAGRGGSASLKELLTSVERLPSLRAEIESVLIRDLLPLIGEPENLAPVEDRPGRAHRWQVLQRAREYIGDHLRETVRMEDLCRHAGASPRTIERMFKQELAMSPSEYVRVRRLNAVKRELVGEAAGDTSVTEIAMRHGFGHLGRFSAAYRKHFGHLPSEGPERAARPQ